MMGSKEELIAKYEALGFENYDVKKARLAEQ